MALQTVHVQRLEMEGKMKKIATRGKVLRCFHIFLTTANTGSGSLDYGNDSIPQRESWCIGLPAEGDSSISFLINKRKISNYSLKDHTIKQIVEVTILNCKVGSSSTLTLFHFTPFWKNHFSWDSQIRFFSSMGHCLSSFLPSLDFLSCCLAVSF